MPALSASGSRVTPIVHPMRAFLAILLALLALLVLAGPGHSRAPQQENILILIGDDLGVDRVRAYGYRNQRGELIAPRTSNLDRLAREGILFRKAWAAPACSQSRATALTGLYSNRTGIGRYIRGAPGAQTGLRDDFVTMADLLPAPYRAAVIGKWHLSDIGGLGSLTGGLDHAPRCGFDLHAGSKANLQPGNPYRDWSMVLSQRWNLPASRLVQIYGRYATTRTTADALRVIESFGNGPWLVWVAYNAPHKPLHIPPANLIQSTDLDLNTDLGQGKAMIEALDTKIGRLLSGIGPEVLARTTVIFFGDNGTQEDLIEPPFPPDKDKGTVYNGGIHVPLLVMSPRIPPRARGMECEALVDVSDLLPTIADLVGVTPPSGVDGVSLLPYFSNPTLPSLRPWIFAERFEPNFIPQPGETIADQELTFHEQTARNQRYKLCRWWEKDTAGNVTETEGFFDLETDYFETTDMLDANGNPPPVLRGHYRELKAVLTTMSS